MSRGISFVVTVFNKEAFVPNTIAALKAQTGDYAREFIFLDDGSTDRSLQVVRDLTAELPNTRVHSQANGGTSVATNRAAAHATHDWIKFVDGDDVIAPWAGDWLLSAVEAAEALGRGGVDGIWCCGDDRAGDAAYPDTSAFGTKPDHFRLDPLADPLDYILRRGLTGMSNTFVRRQAFEAIGGCDERVFVQENSLVMRLAVGHRIALAPEVSLSARPSDAPGRVMDSQAQLLHDMTLATKYLLEDHPGLPDRYRTLAVKKALGRGWKWAKRREGETPLSLPRLFVLNLLAGLRVPLQPATAMDVALSGFRRAGGLRRSG